MSSRSSASPNSDGRQVVLIADGDAQTRATFRDALAGDPYLVHESEDGAEALGKALCHKPAVVIAETQLRRIDGLSLCRLLRAEPATRSTAIIMVTSAESSEVAERVRAAGADHLLGWPLTSEAVRSAVRAMAARTSPDPSPTVRSLREAVPHRTEGAEGAALPGHRSRVRSFPREQTTNPPRTPPPLICPVCNARLTYTYSHTGGVNAESPEQWDYFQCATCGPFQYRHRTRKVKAT